jgi:hypothetical protein
LQFQQLVQIARIVETQCARSQARVKKFNAVAKLLPQFAPGNFFQPFGNIGLT